MSSPQVLYKSSLSSLSLLARGKVRDIYAIDSQNMLIVTTDRLSAFDVVFPDPIPSKGRILTNLANFWFERTQRIIPNHLSPLTPSDVITNSADLAQVEGRAVVVKKLKPLPVEAIVRGYLIGSGWKDYQSSGKICGIALPARMQQATQLPQALYTPSSKAKIGDHDANISFEQTVELLGRRMAEQVRYISLKLYALATDYALQRNIIIADTKFEFGIDYLGNLYLIDEILTPDSSRFWLANQYKVGINPPSLDKQFIRDYLDSLNWDKTASAPHLPLHITQKITQKYADIEAILTKV